MNELPRDYVIIDRKVANAFLHQSSHLNWNWVPKEIMEMEITLRGNLGRTTIGDLIKDGKKRVDGLADYIRLALKGK